MKAIQAYKHLIGNDIFGIRERIKTAKKNPYSRTQRRRNKRR